MHTTSSFIHCQQLELPPCIHQKDGCGAIENSTLPQCPCWTDQGKTMKELKMEEKKIQTCSDVTAIYTHICVLAVSPTFSEFVGSAIRQQSQTVSVSAVLDIMCFNK